MHQGTRTRPATPADFHRLADLAHKRDLRLFRDGQRWFCSSASDRGGCHYVTGFSCDCPGFVSYQRCTHHALLLERLGWLPEIEDAASDPCLWCRGSGRQEDVPQQRYVPCPDCQGTGQRVDRHLTGTPSVEITAAA